MYAIKSYILHNANCFLNFFLQKLGINCITLMIIQVHSFVYKTWANWVLDWMQYIKTENLNCLPISLAVIMHIKEGDKGVVF